jgi:hypothetical protein
MKPKGNGGIKINNYDSKYKDKVSQLAEKVTEAMGDDQLQELVKNDGLKPI